MLLPRNDGNSKKWFCDGVHPASIDRGYRIRLPKEIIEALAKHKVQKLWEYPDPTGPRLILCPPQCQSIYLETAEKHLPASMNAEIAYREFIYGGQLVSFGVQGRILIKQAFRGHFIVKATDDIVVVGLGWFYEVWRERDWRERESNHGT